MNWGYRVIIVLSLFVTLMATMLYISMQQTNEVVESNYYEQEIKYQQTIDRKKNLLALEDSVYIKKEAGVINIEFPPASVSQLDSGNIQFMKLSNSKDDKLIAMTDSQKNKYQVPSTYLSKGWYKVRIEWVSNGKGYYHEQDFNAE